MINLKNPKWPPVRFVRKVKILYLYLFFQKILVVGDKLHVLRYKKLQISIKLRKVQKYSIFKHSNPRWLPMLPVRFLRKVKIVITVSCISQSLNSQVQFIYKQFYIRYIKSHCLCSLQAPNGCIFYM